MKFLIIDPTRCEIRMVDKKQLTDAYHDAGLDQRGVDFATLVREEGGWGVAIILYEFGLLEPPERHRFFSIGERLFAGSAVLFGFDQTGETVTYPEHIGKPPVTFYRSHLEAEAAIQRREIRRPQTAVNGEVVWEWNKSPRTPDKG